MYSCHDFVLKLYLDSTYCELEIENRPVLLNQKMIFFLF
jgi:hypothetical protein